MTPSRTHGQGMQEPVKRAQAPSMNAASTPTHGRVEDQSRRTVNAFRGVSHRQRDAAGRAGRAGGLPAAERGTVLEMVDAVLQAGEEVAGHRRSRRRPEEMDALLETYRSALGLA